MLGLDEPLALDDVYLNIIQLLDAKTYANISKLRESVFPDF